MAVDYANILEQLIEDTTSLLREDSTLLGLIGIKAYESENFIFATRPVKQTKGFKNPRIVVGEAPFLLPAYAGNNADTQHDDTLTFLISGWIDESPWSMNLRIAARIQTLIDGRQVDITEGGKASLLITSNNPVPDEDKERTIQIQLEVTGNIKTEG